MASIRRRDALALALAAVASACTKRHDDESANAHPSMAAGPSTGDELVRDLRFPPGVSIPDGQRALVIAPPNAADLPMLVALHGRGESGRGLDVGAEAWPYNYQLERLHRRLLAPPITADDLHGMTNLERLAKLNRSLEQAPYKGLCVACPYTPDLPDKSATGAQTYARFILDQLLPKARELVKSATTDRTKTAIDGVSMGGRLSLLVGLTHPETFGVVGAIQPAIGVTEATMITDLAKRAMATAPVKLRLVSSEEDPFLPAVQAAAAELARNAVPHELLVIPGEHGYEFNRGPGGVELLLWHERVLRGLPPP